MPSAGTSNSFTAGEPGPGQAAAAAAAQQACAAPGGLQFLEVIHRSSPTCRGNSSGSGVALRAAPGFGGGGEAAGMGGWQGGRKFASCADLGAEARDQGRRRGPDPPRPPHRRGMAHRCLDRHRRMSACNCHWAPSPPPRAVARAGLSGGKVQRRACRFLLACRASELLRIYMAARQLLGWTRDHRGGPGRRLGSRSFLAIGCGPTCTRRPPGRAPGAAAFAWAFGGRGACLASALIGAAADPAAPRCPCSSWPAGSSA